MCFCTTGIYVESEVKIRGKGHFYKKKIKYGIICVVGIGILLSMCFGCKKYDEKRQIESMKKEEQQAVEAANIAEQYVKKYANSLQNSMAIAPLTDLKVEYQEVTWGEYQYGELSDDEETDPYDTADYHYYYKLSYVCDSIDQIFAQMTQSGDYSGYIDLMNKIRMARIEVEDEYKTWEPYEEEINGKIIQTEIIIGTGWKETTYSLFYEYLL